MKCIKSKETNEIVRVSNETALIRVNSNQWVYVPKHEYKQFIKAANKDSNQE